MNFQHVAKDLCDLTNKITEMGPEEPAFDGLRVLQHPSRMLNFLTGCTTQVVPLTLDLWPSIACNAECRLCQYRLSGARTHSVQKDMNQVLSVNQHKEIIQGASTLGIRTVIFTGGGEPLMNPEIIKMVSLAKLSGLGWGIVTNGSLLSPNLTHSLLAEEPVFLRISMDAGCATRYADIYGVKEEIFYTVLNNVITASRIANKLKSHALGVSFTLDSSTDINDLKAIQKLLKKVAEEGDGGLRFVAFRPRLLQYKNHVPVCPQPNGEKFPELVDAIKEYIVHPLTNIPNFNIKLDIKDGLFRLAARKKLSQNCLSGAWMTTISHNGTGYITGELAGAPQCNQDWGLISKSSDFKTMWFDENRTRMHKQLENGDIKVPVVHRTTPVDEFLQMVRKIINEPLEKNAAKELLSIISKEKWYRSSNSDFV